jgi:hypothetical protein
MRRVSRLAEQMFAKQGDVDAIWLIENADGEQQVLVTPVVAPAQPLARIEEKNRLADQIQKHFAENGTVRYARAEEMWLVAREKSEMTRERTALQYAKLGYTLANHPDRREVVHIYGEDATESLFAFRDIIRPAHGKAYLGKLGAIERMDTVEGRWLGLLPNPARDAATRERPPEAPLRRIRSTNELPADVGVEFITAVPDAPMQIRGRRDPGHRRAFPRRDIAAPAGRALAADRASSRSRDRDRPRGRVSGPFRPSLADQTRRGGRAHARRV